MQILPTITSARPRLACELSATAVVAARTGDGTAASDATGPLSAVARVALPPGALIPSLAEGNIVQTAAVTAALREALGAVSGKAVTGRTAKQSSASGTRGPALTLVVPDATVRVLLLEFDALPSKVAEALPVVRFRLKKLLPFDAEDAAISYQVMSSARSLVRVLAVAMPKAVLAEYETAIRAAGYEPGAILPSTLAALAGLGDDDAPVLLVNASGDSVTTAITRGGVLMLHRSIEIAHLTLEAEVLPVAALDIVDREASAAEWAAQEAVVYGVPQATSNGAERPYAGHTPEPGLAESHDSAGAAELLEEPVYDSAIEAAHAERRAELAAELAVAQVASTSLALLDEPPAQEEEIARAISVAAAYYEDTLGVPPATLYTAGPLGANRLATLMTAAGFDASLELREIVSPEAIETAATSSRVSWGELAGVRGALRS